jgi:NAD(P)-dependent dehydrogenase (short-subunit alcohol dehydrogenase family)
MIRLDGKVIVVTGASRGLGEAMALGFSTEGASVVLAARSAGDLERVADACRLRGAAAAAAVPTDVADEAQVGRLVDAALEQFGRIDVFVANAGIGPAALGRPILQELAAHDLDTVRSILATNVVGTWLCLRAALPVLRPGSTVIVVGSETGRRAIPGTGIYAASKAAVHHLTRIAAREAAGKGVTVNGLDPGGMTDTRFFGPGGLPDHLRRVSDLRPEVIVPAAVWLASDDSRDVSCAFVSGKEFNSRTIEQTRAALAAGSGDAT